MRSAAASVCLAVADVRVAQRHARMRVAEHAGDNRQRDPLQHGVARKGVIEPHGGQEAGCVRALVGSEQVIEPRGGKKGVEADDDGDLM